MANLLIIDDQEYRKEKLARYLSEKGYCVSSVSGPESFDTLDLDAFDLFIVNLYPDVDRTWGIYLSLKQQHPSAQVLVYLKESFQTFRGLKQAISSILHDDAETTCKRCAR